MLISQIFFDGFSEIGSIAGITAGCTGLGYIGNRIIQKILPTNKEEKDVEEKNTDIQVKQLHYLGDVTNRLDKVVKQLQDIACYRDPCKRRINGNDESK